MSGGQSLGDSLRVAHFQFESRICLMVRRCHNTAVPLVVLSARDVNTEIIMVVQQQKSYIEQSTDEHPLLFEGVVVCNYPQFHNKKY